MIFRPSHPNFYSKCQLLSVFTRHKDLQVIALRTNASQKTQARLRSHWGAITCHDPCDSNFAPDAPRMNGDNALARFASNGRESVLRQVEFLMMCVDWDRSILASTKCQSLGDWWILILHRQKLKKDEHQCVHMFFQLWVSTNRLFSTMQLLYHCIPLPRITLGLASQGPTWRANAHTNTQSSKHFAGEIPLRLEMEIFPELFCPAPVP